MNAIASYIERKDYLGLITEIAIDEYSVKDRISVYKYVKRVCSEDYLASTEMRMPFLKVRILIKDFPSGNELEDILNNTHYTRHCFFAYIVESCSTQEIIKVIPESMFRDDRLLNVLVNHPKADNKDIIDHLFTIFDFSLIDETFYTAALHDSIKLILKQYLATSPYFLSRLYDVIRKKNNGDVLFKQIIKFYLHYTTRCAEKQFVAVLKYCNLNEIFCPATIEHYFEQACDKNQVQIASAILKSGFRRITKGFNIAVGRLHLPMVKLILPYKPKLDKAWSYCSHDAGSDIGKLIAEARSKIKKKSASSEDKV